MRSFAMPRVVITGMGAITSVGQTVPTFVGGLLSCSSGVRKEYFSGIKHAVPLARIQFVKSCSSSDKRLGHLFRGENPIAALAVPALVEALASAFATEEPRLDSAALIVGTTVAGIHALGDVVVSDDADAKRRLLSEWPAAALPTSLASALGISGPVLVSSAACAAGAQAIIIGTELIRSQVVQRAIVGGYDPISPYTVAGFASLGAITSERVRPFDRDRDGLALGEGAGFLILESLEIVATSDRVIAEIVGVGQSSDGYHLTSPDPDGSGMERAVRAALADAKLTPHEVGYVNAHGTGTRRNDKSESSAYARIFGSNGSSVPISSIKAAIGHTLGAGGVLELIATIGSLKLGYLPPTLNFANRDPECNIDCVPNAPRMANVAYALSASAGFGGVNAAIVVKLH